MEVFPPLGGGGGGGGGSEPEIRTITSGEESAKTLTLANTPTGFVIMLVRGGGVQIQGIDYDVSSNELTWNGYNLDGDLLEGDIVWLIYNHA